MIQINLLPDVKKEYLKAQQMKHMFTVIAVLATVASVGLLTLLFVYVQVLQPRHRANVQGDIDKGIAQLKDTEDAVKIVTVQGVLEQIPGLQDKEMVTSALFGHLTSVTPRDVSYSEVKLDYATSTISVTGQTTTIERANVLANNLKSAEFGYTKNDQSQKTRPFSSVVFGALSKSEQAENGKNVSFQLTFVFDPVLFDQTIKDPKMTTNASSEELLLPNQQPFDTTGGQ